MKRMTFLHDVAAVDVTAHSCCTTIPLAYGTDMTPADFARLADNPRFQAIKESAADTRRFGEIRRRDRRPVRTFLRC